MIDCLDIHNSGKCSEKAEIIKNKDIIVIQESNLTLCKHIFNIFWQENVNIVYITNEKGCLVGIITERSILKQIRENKQEKPFVNREYIVIQNGKNDSEYEEAKRLFEKYNITTSIPVIDKNGRVCYEIQENYLDDEEKIITRFRKKISQYKKSYYLSEEVDRLKKILEEQDIIVIGTENRFDYIFSGLCLNKHRIIFVQKLENAFDFFLKNKDLLIDLSSIKYKGRREIYRYCNNGYLWDQFLINIFDAVESESCSKLYRMIEDESTIFQSFLTKILSGSVCFSKVSMFTNIIINYMKEKCFDIADQRKGIFRNESFQYRIKLNGIEAEKFRQDHELVPVEWADMIFQLCDINKQLYGKIAILNFAFDGKVDATDAEINRMKRNDFREESPFFKELHNYSELYNLKNSGKDYLIELTNSLKIDYTRTFENNRIVLKDIYSRLVNIENGIRRTCYQPKNYNGTIYFLGACTIWGGLVEDQYTIPSFIQKYINKLGAKYRVVNLGSGNLINSSCLLENLCIEENDIFVILFPFLIDEIKKELKIIEVGDQFNAIRKNKYKGAECFFDMVQHCGTNGNIIYSEIIFEELKKYISTKGREKRNQLYHIFKKDYRDLEILYEYKSYIDELKKEAVNAHFDENRKNGCIVMNCNPFTLGHRYLIEYAAEKVDFLYLFVLEEDKSFFSFKDRYEMVKRGTADLKNVFVFRSGNMIISSETFPAYFHKQEGISLAQSSVSIDLKVFGQYIAPNLNIQNRFVGEEPIDLITASYNQKMKEILPEFGIEVIEIPRKSIAGEIISASIVRKCYHKNDFDTISKWVPHTTFQYLLENRNR